MCGRVKSASRSEEQAAAESCSRWPECLFLSSCCLTAQVLATGLSGLYSSLPTKLEVPSEDWHCLHREDWLQMPSLVQFLNSLEFCNAVIQVGAALHQTDSQLGYSLSKPAHPLLTGCPS